MNMQEVCDLFGLSKALFYHLIDDGKIIKVQKANYTYDKEYFKNFSVKEYWASYWQRPEVIKRHSDAQKKVWANLSDEERQEKERKLKESQNRLEVKEKKSQKNKAFWANASEERLQEHAQAVSKGMREYLDNMTEEEQQRFNEKQARINSIRWSNITPEEKEQWRQKVCYGVNYYYEHMTPEQKQEQLERCKKAMNRPDVKEKLSKARINWYNNLTEEELEKFRKQCSDCKTLEVRKKLSKALKEYRDNLTEEEKLEQRRAVSEAVKHAYAERHDEILARIRETKKANGSFNSSKWEDDSADLLRSLGLTIHRWYNTPRYPFDCDIYIEEFDLFIECNYGWMHGYKPYDPNDEFCQKQLKDWESRTTTRDKHDYYWLSICTWTERDIEKVTWAKEHGLNFFVFYYLEDFIDWVNKLKGLLGYDN